MSNLIKFCQETNLVCLSKFMGVILSYSCFEHSSMLTEGDIYAYMQTCFTFLKRSKKTKETHQGCQRWPAISWGRFYPGSLEAPHPSPRSGLQLYKKKSMKTRSGSPQIKDIHITISSIYQRTTSTNDQAELSVNRMSTSSTKSDQNPRTENNSTSTTATSIIITTNQVQFSPSQRRPSPPTAPSLPSSSSWLPWSPKDLEIRKQLNMYDVRVLLKNEKG